MTFGRRLPWIIAEKINAAAGCALEPPLHHAIAAV